MFPSTEFFTPSTRTPDRMTLPLRHCLSAFMTAVLLAGCGAGPSGQRAAETATAQAQLATAVAEAARASASRPTPAAGNTASAGDDATTRMLAYAERVRLMQPPELNQEIARLGDAASPSAQLQLSLALSQLRQLPELVRAQELLARVLGNAEAQALHPLARLLASRYGEQRRLEEQLEKQNQQLRDVQRRLDQTNERLEALKAIERSLTSRPPAAPASAPAANRPRTAAP
jgi:hypothetical protein